MLKNISMPVKWLRDWRILLMMYMHIPDSGSFSMSASYSSLEQLYSYVQSEHFIGYDPYDTLNAKFPFKKLGKWIPILATQFQKRNPVNIRPLLGIQKEINPKAYGLFINAFSKQYMMTGDQKYLNHCREMICWLSQHTAKGYTHACWGYNFDWASPIKVVPAFTPSVVCTAFIVKGLFSYYKATGDLQAKELIISASQYVLEDLPRYQNEHGICISYTDIQMDICYNANLLGAEILGYAYSLTGVEEYRTLARQALDFTVHYQHEDGRWNYSLNLETGKEREQIDFHQGYVLESAWLIISLCKFGDTYNDYLKKGLSFYKEMQFYPDGRSLWRLPRIWPVEIHNQSQGIITFSKLQNFSASYRLFAKTIAEWTIKNMQDKNGYFHYQKHKWYTIKIPYMRWSQAWMYLALTDLIYNNKS
ncbi:glycoside hydrolase family 127 protein [Balneolales bacterium ANBcel1]|nr:glycoside hydrolase family 127 protein [Balneolales bacterium ANBcel1]